MVEFGEGMVQPAGRALAVAAEQGRIAGQDLKDHGQTAAGRAVLVVTWTAILKVVPMLTVVSLRPGSEEDGLGRAREVRGIA